MIETYQRNSGIVVFNQDKKVLMFRRVHEDDCKVWQFPQGKIEEGETPLEAGLRELQEETGITSVRVVKVTDEPIQYDFPPETIAKFKEMGRMDIGKLQYWVLVFFYGIDAEIKPLEAEEVELTEFEWLGLEQPVLRAWEPKRKVYEIIMKEFGPIIERYKNG